MKQNNLIWYRGTMENRKKIKGVFDVKFNTFDAENLIDYLIFQYPQIRFAQYSFNKTNWEEIHWMAHHI